MVETRLLLLLEYTLYPVCMTVALPALVPRQLFSKRCHPNEASGVILLLNDSQTQRKSLHHL